MKIYQLQGTKTRLARAGCHFKPSCLPLSSCESCFFGPDILCLANLIESGQSSKFTTPLWKVSIQPIHNKFFIPGLCELRLDSEDSNHNSSIQPIHPSFIPGLCELEAEFDDSNHRLTKGTTHILGTIASFRLIITVPQYRGNVLPLLQTNKELLYFKIIGEGFGFQFELL